MACAPSHMSCVTCHMSCVEWYMSHVTCHLPPVTNAKIYNNIPSPANSPIIKSKGRSRSQNFKPVTVTHHEKMEIVWLLAKGWGHKIDDGVVAAKKPQESSRALRLHMPSVLGKCSHKKNWISKTIFFFLQKNTPVPFSYFFSKMSSVPLWANVLKKAIIISDGCPENSCWGQGNSMN